MSKCIENIKKQLDGSSALHERSNPSWAGSEVSGCTGVTTPLRLHTSWHLHMLYNTDVTSEPITHKPLHPHRALEVLNKLCLPGVMTAVRCDRDDCVIGCTHTLICFQGDLEGIANRCNLVKTVFRGLTRNRFSSSKTTEKLIFIRYHSRSRMDVMMLRDVF